MGQNPEVRAALYREFKGEITVEEVADPEPASHGIVIEVRASGLCRSDLWGWHGHDADITLPHVPGHELAGVVAAVGPDVRRFEVGDRVTTPFCGGCGDCKMCVSGNAQVCDHPFQPGFTAWGSFAELVAIEQADVNVVTLPDDLDFSVAAVLGCRFVTAYRAVVDRGRPDPGQWTAVHGCGGLGLSAVMIATAMGARVVAVDIDAAPLRLARDCGAEITIDASDVADVPAAVTEATEGGAHVSLDCLGSVVTAANSLLSLRKLGRHVQVGLLDNAVSPVPLAAVVARELEIVGSHGIAADRYPELLDLIAAGRLDPGCLLTTTMNLDELPAALVAMEHHTGHGVAVVDRF